MSRFRVDYRLWLFRLFGYDGLLPVFIVFIPWALQVLFRNPEWAALTAAIIPPCAFLIRICVGKWQIERNHCGKLVKHLQMVFLGLAILPLMVVDVFIIMDVLWPNMAQAQRKQFLTEREWIIFLKIYAGYFAVMVFAMYPGKTIPVAATQEEYYA